MISFSILIHKWSGLFTAVFLIVAGVTGSLLAFENELEALVNPAQYVVQPRLDDRGQPATMLDPFELHAGRNGRSLAIRCSECRCCDSRTDR